MYGTIEILPEFEETTVPRKAEQGRTCRMLQILAAGSALSEEQCVLLRDIATLFNSESETGQGRV